MPAQLPPLNSSQRRPVTARAQLLGKKASDQRRDRNLCCFSRRRLRNFERQRKQAPQKMTAQLPPLNSSQRRAVTASLQLLGKKASDRRRDQNLCCLS